MKIIVVVISAIIVVIIGWCAYAVSLSDTALADRSRCNASPITRAVNGTRQLLHVKTGDDINTELMKTPGDPLKLSPSFACPQ